MLPQSHLVGLLVRRTLAIFCAFAALASTPVFAADPPVAPSSGDATPKGEDAVAPTTPVANPALAPSRTLDVAGDNSNELGKPFGRVRRITGDVAATASDSTEARHLKQGDAVRVGDHLQSALGGEVLIEESDGGLLALRPATELWIESYAADGKPSDHSILRLLAGGARAVTGWIGHLNRPGVRMVTPTATIGIRGTDHEAFVLSPEMADADREAQGSYDKVNRGATVLTAANQDLAIAPGQVGFVGAAKPSTRGLMTLLLPVLLKKVPSFYVPGQFDREIDDYAKTADKTSDQMLAQFSGGAGSSVECDPTKVGTAWLKALDAGQDHRDYKEILRLYADDATIKATVRNRNGEATEVSFDHNQFADSVEASMKGLKNFHQQRSNVKFQASPDRSSQGCADVVITSSVAERGEMQGRSYRLQSIETYTLELRNNRWLGVASITVQQ